MNGLSQILVAAVTIPLIGCATVPWKESQERPATHYQFEGVPIHSDLKVDINQSFIFEIKGRKGGIIVYHGSKPVSEILEFFKAEMPKHAWRLMLAVKRKRAEFIYYEKRGWRVLIRVGQVPPATYVEITLNPSESKESILPPSSLGSD